MATYLSELEMFTNDPVNACAAYNYWLDCGYSAETAQMLTEAKHGADTFSRQIALAWVLENANMREIDLR